MSFKAIHPLAIDHGMDLTDGVADAMDRRLSDLDESRAFGENWTCSRALNASLTLSHDDGTTEDFIDLCSSYGAVNFGHCNEDIRLPAHPGADLVAGIYPPEAEKFARWLTNALDVSDFKVLFQVGGSFAVSTALSLALRNRPGKILAIEGGFHGLGLDALSATTSQRSMALHETPIRQSLASFVKVLKPGGKNIDWSAISCLIFEPIQGARGYVPLDAGWLRELCAEAKAAGVIVIADEIHGDLILPGNTFTAYGTLGKAFEQQAIICTAASKTFNLAGLHCSNIMIADEALREGLAGTIRANGLSGMNPFSLLATETAYREAEGWLDAVLDYIAGNAARVAEVMAERAPMITVRWTESWARSSQICSGQYRPIIPWCTTW